MENGAFEKKEGKASTAIQKGLRVIAILGALGATNANVKAEAGNQNSIVAESLRSSTVTEVLKENMTIEEGQALSAKVIEEIFADGKVMPEEAKALREVWEKVKPTLPEEMTEGEAGELVEKYFSGLDALAEAEAELLVKQRDLATTSMEMSMHFMQKGDVGYEQGVDLYAEGQMVEYSDNEAKTAEEIQEEINDVTERLKVLGADTEGLNENELKEHYKKLTDEKLEDALEQLIEDNRNAETGKELDAIEMKMKVITNEFISRGRPI